MTEDEYEECLLDAGIHCSLCDATTSDKCNNKLFPEDRQKCHKCTGLGCESTSTEISSYCDVANDECISFNNFGLKKRCLNDLSENEVLFCQNNPTRCSICSGNDCNSVAQTFPKYSCRLCDSSSNKLCISQPKNVTVTKTSCQDGCVSYTKQSTNGRLTTSRGCLETLTETEQNRCTSDYDSTTSVCRKCLGDDCNGDIFPETRLLCYVCNTPPCQYNLNPKLEYSEYYDPNDRCVAIIKNENVTKLAFKSSLTAAEITSCDSDPTCVLSICDGDRCNDPRSFVQTISCVKCDTNTDRECTTQPEGKYAVPCNTDSYYPPLCYQKLKGTKVLRGCFNDLPVNEVADCINDPSKCELCDAKSGCNNQIYPANRLYCHQCSSKTKEDCREVITNLEPEMCVDYDPNNKCYALKHNDGEFVRTCGSNKNQVCANTASCEECNTKGCNTARINAGNNESLSTFALLFALLSLMPVYRMCQ